jgi:hypothetical protein
LQPVGLGGDDAPRYGTGFFLGPVGGGLFGVIPETAGIALNLLARNEILIIREIKWQVRIR